MFTNEGLLRREPSVQAPASSEMTLVAIILILFLLLHLFAAAVVQRAGAGRDAPSEQNVTLELYD